MAAETPARIGLRAASTTSAPAAANRRRTVDAAATWRARGRRGLAPSGWPPPSAPSTRWSPPTTRACGPDHDQHRRRPRFTAEPPPWTRRRPARAGHPRGRSALLYVDESAPRQVAWAELHRLVGSPRATCAPSAYRPGPRPGRLHPRLPPARPILDTAPPGEHHLVCSVSATPETLVPVLHADEDTDGTTDLDEAEALEFTSVLAVGLATHAPGGLVMRTSAPGPRRVSAGACAATASPPSPRARSSTPTAPTPHPATSSHRNRASTTASRRPRRRRTRPRPPPLNAGRGAPPQAERPSGQHMRPLLAGQHGLAAVRASSALSAARAAAAARSHWASVNLPSDART
ncbi:hypothetical protein SFUMM280S_06198 [Streptomyces fumanus]